MRGAADELTGVLLAWVTQRYVGKSGWLCIEYSVLELGGRGM